MSEEAEGAARSAEAPGSSLIQHAASRQPNKCTLEVDTEQDVKLVGIGTKIEGRLGLGGIGAPTRVADLRDETDQPSLYFAPGSEGPAEG